MNLTFGQKIFYSVLCVAGISVLLISIPLMYYSASHFDEIASDHAQTDSVMLSTMVEPALVFERMDMAESILEILQESQDVVGANVYAVNPLDGSLSEFARYGDQTLFPGLPQDLPSRPRVTKQDGHLLAMSPVRTDGDVIGYVRVVASPRSIQEHFWDILAFVIVAVIVAMLVASYFAVASRRSISRPIRDLSRVTQLIAETKDYSSRAVATSEDEVGDLIASFNAMLAVIEEYDAARKEKEDEILQLNQSLERKVEERTLELQNSMDVLSKTVQDLRDTQTKLVEQEKMASLGSLVAGVAHEINTPIGVGITASSHLGQSIRDLQGKFVEGRLTKRDFSDAVEEMTETVVMISKNLERSAALVKSFKMVAVDQSSDDMRHFNVKEYFESVLLSLKPKLKRTQHTVELDIPPRLTVYSSPGALSQIVTNLVMNSLLHGFDEVEKGSIDIQVIEDGDTLELNYYDDGKGIPASMKDRIFDPFVTTARHKGGSGLGTHILYNLVTQVLGGTVSLENDRPRGVHFRIRFPIKSQDVADPITMAGAQ